MAPKKTITSPPTKTRKRKEKKDPNAPKRTRSAYRFFCNDRREEIIKEDPKLRSNVTEVTKLISADWRALTDDQKAPYNKLAEADKIRYRKDKEAYQQTLTAA